MIISGMLLYDSNSRSIRVYHAKKAFTSKGGDTNKVIKITYLLTYILTDTNANKAIVLLTEYFFLPNLVLFSANMLMSTIMNYCITCYEPVPAKTNNLGSDHVRHKPTCTVTGDGKRLEILDLESRGTVLSV